jgi:hypothetical protein
MKGWPLKIFFKPWVFLGVFFALNNPRVIRKLVERGKVGNQPYIFFCPQAGHFENNPWK